MATSLGKVGIVNKGEYSTESTYNAGDFVLYKGSTWLSLKDGLLGVEPVEGTNWKYLARGFEAEVLSLITATDTSGLLGDAGQQVNAQSLMDVIADKVATKLLEKGMIVDNFTSERGDLPGSAANDKRLYDMIDDVNKNINGTFYETGDLIEWANSKHETMLGSFSSACINLPSTGNFDVIRFEHGGYLASMIAIRQFDRKMFVSEYNTVAWSDWTEYVTNSDLKNLIVRRRLDLQEVILNAGETLIPFDYTSIMEGYDLLAILQPSIAYTGSHVPARITFTEYQSIAGTMRVYSDTNVAIRLFLEVLLIKK